MGKAALAEFPGEPRGVSQLYWAVSDTVKQAPRDDVAAIPRYHFPSVEPSERSSFGFPLKLGSLGQAPNKRIAPAHGL